MTKKERKNAILSEIANLKTAGSEFYKQTVIAYRNANIGACMAKKIVEQLVGDFDVSIFKESYRQNDRIAQQLNSWISTYKEKMTLLNRKLRECGK